MGDRVRVGDFEAALLQILAEIENRAAHEERALRIDHDSDVAGLNHDVAVGRTIDKIHFILQPGAAAADHRDPQRALGASLFLQERRRVCAPRFPLPGRGARSQF